MLRCVECRTVDDRGHGWRPLLVPPDLDPDEYEDGSAFVVVYCPACAEREFGPVRRTAGSNS
jgi:hypothetical protein